MKVTFDTKADPLDEVLRAVQAGYGVTVSIAEASQTEASQGPEQSAEGSSAELLLGPEKISEPKMPTPTREVKEGLDARSTTSVKRVRANGASRTNADESPTPGAAVKRKAASKSSSRKPEDSKKAPARPQAKQKTGGRRPGAAASGRTGSEPKARTSRAVAKKSASPVAPSAAIVRSWARAQGMDNVSSRGKVSASLYEAYIAAHA